MGHDIVISYSHEDKTSADAACAILESERLHCWIAPRDILPGSEWTESIIDGIGGAKALVLIFSRGADESAQVRRELERAIHHAIPIVPVRIEDVTPGKAMEYLISTPQRDPRFRPSICRSVQLRHSPCPGFALISAKG
jgi:TIR domain